VIRVQLIIVDINDNAPMFSQQRVSITLSELTPPKDLFPLMPATDVDSPANGVAGYRLTVLESTEPSPFFDVRVTTVNSSTSTPAELRLVLLQPLDHETADRHHLRVLAYDMGTPALTRDISTTRQLTNITSEFWRTTWERRRSSRTSRPRES